MGFNIDYIKLNDKKLLLSQNSFSNNNIFTLLTGKNGTGKTRLLTSIVKYFAHIETSANNSPPENFKILNANTNASFSYSKKPERIIVHTNSKYSKFPDKYDFDYQVIKNYFNVSGDSYISSFSFYEDSFFGQIILNSNINIEAISDTLSYLNYYPFLKLRLKLNWLNFPAGYYEKTIQNHKEILQEEVGFNTNTPFKKASRTDKYFLAALLFVNDRKFKKLTAKEIKLIYQAFKTFDIVDGVMEVDIDLKLKKFKFFNTTKAIIKVLLKNNIVRFSNVYLLRSLDEESIFSSKQLIDFVDLSSGQQAIINTLLGISGVIADNSLICIDEPEISLHPEWQSEIINQLQLVFQDIQGCHFLIATHSPQVVSSLKSENSFIVNLEKMKTYNASEHNHKSADYQLAKIFDTPGYNNEFLIRVGLVILSKISKREKLLPEDYENIKLFKEVKDSIPQDDAVFFLIEQILSLAE